MQKLSCVLRALPRALVACQLGGTCRRMGRCTRRLILLVGLLMLGKGQAVKVGLIGSMLFVVGLAGVSVIQIAWAGMLVGQGYLLTKEFDRSFLDMLRGGAGTADDATA